MRRVNLGLKDLLIFVVYMMMTLPIPQLVHYVFRNWAWPVEWKDQDFNIWGFEYMEHNSKTSSHRWYLWMVLQARVFLQLMEKLRAPSWLQALLVLTPCCIPNSAFSGELQLLNVCGTPAARTYLNYIFFWIFRDSDNGCFVYIRWIQWYMSFYVLSFLYLRPLVEVASKRMPSNRTFGAIAFSSSMMIGLIMAMFHYPNEVLETGSGLEWAWLELTVDIVQPALVVIGMSYVSFDMAWWGNTTLGCYVFHFYFRDQMGLWFMSICDILAWDASGLLPFFCIIGCCMLFGTICGPLGHYLLLGVAYGPALVYARAKQAIAEVAKSRPTTEPDPFEAQTSKPATSQDSGKKSWAA